MNGHPSTCSCVYCNHSGANNGMYGRKHSVAALEKMRNRIFSEQTRKKMSESQKKKTVNPLAGLKISAALKGRPHSVEHNNKVRAALAGKPKSAEHKEKLRLSALKRTVKFFDTAIELKIESVLVLMGVKYVKQYSVADICNVDFYLPDSNLVIEADGDYWHANAELHSRGKAGAKRRAKDYARTQVMMSRGLKVLRLWEHEINSMSTAQIKARIASVL